MKKINVLNKISKIGIIAVVRGSTKGIALNSCKALIKGNIHGIEVTFSAPKADEIIAELKNEYAVDSNIVIGAGTVLDATTARISILAGADFVVSPYFDMEIAKICNLYCIPYIPGCMTINEVKESLKMGVDIIKLFPGSTVGMDFVSAIKAPLPQVSIMPTGGVDLNNMKDWFVKGVVAVGVGGNLLKGAEEGKFEEITKLATSYQEEYKRIISK